MSINSTEVFLTFLPIINPNGWQNHNTNFHTTGISFLPPPTNMRWHYCWNFFELHGYFICNTERKFQYEQQPVAFFKLFKLCSTSYYYPTFKFFTITVDIVLTACQLLSTVIHILWGTCQEEKALSFKDVFYMSQ